MANIKRALVLQAVQSEFLGRVSSFRDLAIDSGSLLGNGISFLIVARWGTSFTFATSALIALLVLPVMGSIKEWDKTEGAT